MRRFLFLSMLLASMLAFAQEASHSGTHTYDVQWQWGWVNMDAGQAVVSLDINPGSINASFTGHSVSIGGKIYSIADTLRATYDGGLVRVSHINGYYSKHKKGQTGTFPYRTIHGAGSLDASSSTMEAVSITAYLLGFYYYAFELDFDSISPGSVINKTMIEPDGNHRLMRITYNGRQDFGSCDDAYSLTVNFEYDGSMSRYPVQVFVNPQTRMPISFSANIKIGHVAMTLVR